MQKIFEKIKKIKIRDLSGILIFFVLLIPSYIYKIYLKMHKKELWLISEKENMARDNGKIFYKYLKNNHPEIKSYYAINFNSEDFKYIKQYGNIVKWASIKHYFIYMTATKNISSHKEGNPNQTLFTILHIYLKLYNNRIFLQHGVLYNDFEMFHKKNTYFKLFITGAKPEYEYICEKYGYDDEVRYTGLARFDELHEFEVDNKCILLIPTWRRWLDTEESFIESDYYKKLQQLINEKQLQDFLEKYDKYLYFYPHISTQKYINNYTTNSKRIKILEAKDIDIQKLLKKGVLLITDYSSIVTDFAYMKKPVIYYQYDKEEFFQKHYKIPNPMSYFDYKENGFGDVVNSKENLIKAMKCLVKRDFIIEDKYEERINAFFELHDKNNCKRIFDAIMER